MQTTEAGKERWWIALMVAIAVALATPNLVKLLNALIEGKAAGGDFNHWVWQAEIAFNRGLSPYLGESIKAAGLPTYASFYPPFNLVVFWPFTLLPIAIALLVQWAISTACLAGLLVVLTTRFEPIARHPRMQALVLACACFSTGVRLTFGEGQVNIDLALLLTVVLLWSADKARDRASGALLALAALLKFYFILLLPLLILRRRWQAALAAGAVLGVALLVTAIFFPSGAWGDWLDFVRSSGFGKTPHNWAVQLFAHNQSLNGYLSVLFGDSKLTSVLGLSLSAGIVVATALSIWLRRHGTDELFWPRAIAATVMATYLIAPLAWLHYFVVHLAVAAWLWSQADMQGARRSATIIACLMVYCSLPWVDMMLGSVGSVARWFPLWGTVGLWLMALAPWSDATTEAEEG